MEYAEEKAARSFDRQHHTNLSKKESSRGQLILKVSYLKVNFFCLPDTTQENQLNGCQRGKITLEAISPLVMDINFDP